MADPFEYSCSCCGERHVGFPDLAFDAPWHYHALPAEERAGAVLTNDVCTIGDDRFIRGTLDIPIVGRAGTFSYGVWVSLSAANFQRYLDLYEARDDLPPDPWFGWFCNRLPGYPDTLNLKTHVHLRPYPARPRIELEPTDHPLALEQRQGISLDRWRAICEVNQHST
jgi:hypothetical protein